MGGAFQDDREEGELKEKRPVASDNRGKKRDAL